MTTSDEAPSDPQRSIADGNARYQYKSLKVIRGTEGKAITKWQSDGWELHAEQTGKIRTELTFRRVQPRPFGTLVAGLFTRFRQLQSKTQLALAAAAGVVILLVVVGILMAVPQDGDEPVKASTPPAKATSTPSGQESEGPAEGASPTEADQSTPSARDAGAFVERAIRTFLSERSAAGVVVAQAATDVSYRNRILVVTFDPKAVNMGQETFDQINPFNNPHDRSESLADFVATPLAFNDDMGVRLRKHIDRIQVVNAEGQQIGVRTTAEIIKLNDLDH